MNVNEEASVPGLNHGSDSSESNIHTWGGPGTEVSEKDLTRFWSKIKRPMGDGCWEWLGGKSPRGYGIIKIKRRMTRASRVSWFIFFGQIPNGILVCHRCDNPPCCNPDHLFLGTSADNNRDRHEKGRDGSNSKKFKGMLVGEKHPMVKLTWNQVEKIRDAYSKGGMNQYELASLYGVKQSTIWCITSLKTWKPEHRPV